MSGDRHTFIARKLLAFLTLLLALFSPTASAWDSTGHRISAAIALAYISEDTRDELLAVLAAHPRYQEDFLAQVPDFVDRDNANAMALWLLGQAAYWPDIARGLPGQARRRFNRPPWHYTDGAWMRGATRIQGNVYVDLPPFPDLNGRSAQSITSENDVSNVVTAIDYNASLLFDTQADPAQRAVALCWVLHLIGDIHQPLHAGSLFSSDTFNDGDRGGNGIPVGDRNLHSRWDRALAKNGVLAELELILGQLATAESSTPDAEAMDWTLWLNESRELLQLAVYADFIVAEIRDAEAEDRSMRPLDLSADYVAQMQDISRQRLGLAGKRLGLLFEANFAGQ